MSLLGDLKGSRDYWMVMAEDGGPLPQIVTVARGANNIEIERKMLLQEHAMAKALGYDGPLPSDSWIEERISRGGC